MNDQQLGKYKVLEEIGRGGFATVYKARDTASDRIVALKVLAPHLLWDRTFVHRFQAEFETVAGLRHRNIVTVYEHGDAEGQPYIAMECIHGATLAQLLQKSDEPLSLERVLGFVEQLASALTYALRRNVIHRDIKPSNIMIDAQDHVLLTDFGIAKASSRTFQTTTGRVFGSPEYMSPEQVRGEALDHRSDIYSLGIVLYELLTHRPPFTGDTPLSVMLNHAEYDPPPPSELNSSIPAAVEAVVLKALAKSPQDRFQSAGELLHYLRRAVEGKPVMLSDSRAAEPDTPPVEPPEPIAKRAINLRWVLAAGAFLGLIGCCVVIDSLGPILSQTPTPLAAIVSSLLTDTPTATPIPSPVPTETPSPTNTRTPLPTPTHTPLPTNTQTPSPEPTQTPWVITATPLPPTSLPTPCPLDSTLVDNKCVANTPIPSSTPTPRWTRVFYDTFSTDEAISTNDRRTWYIQGGELHVDVHKSESITWQYANGSETYDENYVILVKVRLFGDPAPFRYGLIFGGHGSEFFAFRMDDERRYSLCQHTSEGWQDRCPWRPFSEIKPEADDVNRIRMEYRDGDIYLFINDEPINDDDPITWPGVAGGQVGVCVSSVEDPVSVAFDDFAVYVLQ
ncbi:MAG: serine/threonine protein kinase [Chloroflexi bacterium]|nr:serine/threonine protein kinase [Chloroflexota bacterium]